MALSWKELFVWKFDSLSVFLREFRIISLTFELNIGSHLLDPQSVFTWSNILIAVPQRSGLESRGHSVTVGKTILSIGKVSTTDFMGFSIQPASTNLIFNFLISMSCLMLLQCLPPLPPYVSRAFFVSTWWGNCKKCKTFFFKGLF